VGTVAHPRIRPGTLDERLFQERIAERAVQQNTLVVLPTGLGKTAIALRVMAEYLLRNPGKSILFMAPTRPLVVQHSRSVEATLFGPSPLVLTGAIPPARRADLLHPPQVVVATPQVIANDLEQGEFPLETFSLVVFDEAHRAVGDYPYVSIGTRLKSLPQIRVLAMTASPGSREPRIREVWTNLSIEHFELRNADDPDVRPYSHAIGVEALDVPVPPEVRLLGTLLRATFAHQTEQLFQLGVLAQGQGTLRDLLEAGNRLRRQIEQARRRGEPAAANVWKAMTVQSVAMKAHHAASLIETQGVEALREFLERQATGRKTPAANAFLSAPEVSEVIQRLRALHLEHPKVAKAIQVVTEEIGRKPDARVIVFAHYRQTAEFLVEEFGKQPQSAVRAARFVGQASRGTEAGLSQKEQVETLDRFSRGEINCLVATSVAEEGLDIPTTDLVLLYEPVPDEIRTIQRRGRTGRTRAGRVVVLLAEGTRDIAMWRSAKAKERRMHEMLLKIEQEARRGPLRPAPVPTVQKRLLEYSPSETP
jgi:ERCC4-related helicase